MSYVTISMLAEHARKTPQAVRDALRAAGYEKSLAKITGVRGFRIEAKDADKFLSRHWPQVGPIRLPGAVK
jgi:methylmalonyl-CoA mutase cobalamin-binding subunit